MNLIDKLPWINYILPVALFLWTLFIVILYTRLNRKARQNPSEYIRHKRKEQNTAYQYARGADRIGILDN
jgi:hypothetical protein